MKTVFNHVSKFLWWLADIIFGLFVVIAVILIISVIFYPHDNLLLQLGRWLSQVKM